MIDVDNPAEVDREIAALREQLEKAAAIVNERRVAYQDAKRAYEVAFAKAWVNYAGPQGEKKQRATLATAQLAEVRDAAYAAYQYARDRSSDLRNQLRALQTIAANLREAYRTVNYGQ